MKPTRIRIELRLSPDEKRRITELSKPYGTVSRFLRTAVDNFTGMSPRDESASMLQIVTMLMEYRDHAAHLGGNVNQTLKHANELAKTGLMTQTQLNECVDRLMEADRGLRALRQGIETMLKRLKR